MSVIEDDVDMFVSDTVAVDVEPRVEKPTVASTSTDVVHDDAWYDQLFDDLNYRRTDKEIQERAIRRADVLIRDICDVHQDVQFDFDFEECDSDGEGYKGDDVPDLMSDRPRRTGKEPRETEWERYTRVTVPYVEEAHKKIFAYHVRELDREKGYGVQNMPEEKKIAYYYMRRNRKKEVSEVRTNLKVKKVVKFDLIKFTCILYPEITVLREDDREWVFTEADFPNVEPLLLRDIIFSLRRDTNRPLEKTMAMEAIMRHLEVTAVIAHLYDFQLALESWAAKMNVQKPARNLFDDELDYPDYTVFADEKDLLTCVYPDSKKVKRRMYMHEVALFSDGTLKIVLKELKKKLQLHKMTFSVMGEQEHFLVQKFVEAIEERLKIRDDMRAIEVMLKLRRRFPSLS
jgi:hypothetical protein